MFPRSRQYGRRESAAHCHTYVSVCSLLSLILARDIDPLIPRSDELKSDEPLRRLNSITRLGTIAVALGEDRTRSELVPFLNENTDDEDEVLLAEAEQLGNFVPFVGGSNFAHCLLPLLENLATVEETVVRDKAVESVCKVGAQLPDSSVCEHLVPMLKVGGSLAECCCGFEIDGVDCGAFSGACVCLCIWDSTCPLVCHRISYYFWLVLHHTTETGNRGVVHLESVLLWPVRGGLPSGNAQP